MKNGLRHFRLYEKVLILEHENFEGFTGMIVKGDMVDPPINGDGQIVVMVGDEEDVALGLGPCRLFDSQQLKSLGKNLRKEVRQAGKGRNEWTKIY